MIYSVLNLIKVYYELYILELLGLKFRVGRGYIFLYGLYILYVWY